MPELRQKERSPVTLEQLLKLKRSERPGAAFWEDFDRELRRRQLASVVTAPAWYVRLGRATVVGLRRCAPVAAAAVAAVAGFLALQRSPQQASDSTDVPASPMARVDPAPVHEPFVPEMPSVAISSLPLAPEPEIALPATGEPRFVVHEFVADAAPARTFVSVTSPNTFSSPAYDAARIQMVNTLTSAYSRRTASPTEAGRF